MSLSIDTLIVPSVPETSVVRDIVRELCARGYDPLITKAKEQFAEVFGASLEKAAPSQAGSEDIALELAYRNRALRYRPGASLTVAGEVFPSPSGTGVLYLAQTVTDPAFARSRSKVGQAHIEVGFIGDDTERLRLDAFAECVLDALRANGVAEPWSRIELSSPQFAELSHAENNRFTPATEVAQTHRDLAAILGEDPLRDLAVLVKRSGGILATDLYKKAEGQAELTQKMVERLAHSGLVSKEFVVICRKTSNQVNRVDAQEKIERMSEMGILCSCGSPIAGERVEELYTASRDLQRLLDQSYWMTASLLNSLLAMGVPEDRVLLNLSEGPEEIDAFVDLEGTLLMFELKDNTFSMGHAYPFGGRIGLYKPDVALIVATKGVAPEVREYFRKVEPDSQLLYIDTLSSLDASLNALLNETRSRRALEILSQFEPIASLEVPVSALIASKLGIDTRARARRRS